MTVKKLSSGLKRVPVMTRIVFNLIFEEVAESALHQAGRRHMKVDQGRE